MQFIITQEQKNRRLGYALAQATGQTPGGFSITTKANKPNGIFDGTYTVTIPDGKITQAEFDAIVANPEQEDVSGELYKQLRKAEYPSLEDQFDMIFHDLEANDPTVTTWRDAIRAVKAKYPKP